MGIKETPDGGNATFDCSPSGPCIPCSRSEKVPPPPLFSFLVFELLFILRIGVGFSFVMYLA